MKNNTKKEIKSSVLSDVLRKAASLAVQMEISEKEATDLFGHLFKKIRSQKERKPE
jgi:hypothetical protein